MFAFLAGEEEAVVVRQGHSGCTEKKTAATESDHRRKADPYTNEKNHGVRNHRDHDRRHNDHESGLGENDCHLGRHSESHDRDRHRGDDNRGHDPDYVLDVDHCGHLEDKRSPTEWGRELAIAC